MIKRYILYWNEGYHNGPIIEFKTYNELRDEYEAGRWEPDIISDIYHMNPYEVYEPGPHLLELLLIMRVDDIEDDDQRTFTVEVKPCQQSK